MIKYFLAPNQLVTGPTWAAKHAEMTQGFSLCDGKPVAVCCLKQTLATGDFHQLCPLRLKVCNNIAFYSPNFFLMSVRHPSTDSWSGFWGGWVVVFISNCGIFQNKYIFIPLPVIKID